tara:strand:+ start:1961 stop:2209 length:249 start_codon:yes stop_codon:yes gene_type:complete
MLIIHKENIYMQHNDETFDIVIKCDTEEQRDLVLDKVDELKNKPCGSVWYDMKGWRNGTRPAVTNVMFKDGSFSNREECEVI